MSKAINRSGSLVKCPLCEDGGFAYDDGSHLACNCYSYSDVSDATPGGFIALPMTADLFECLTDDEFPSVVDYCYRAAR